MGSVLGGNSSNHGDNSSSSSNNSHNSHNSNSSKMVVFLLRPLGGFRLVGSPAGT